MTTLFEPTDSSKTDQDIEEKNIRTQIAEVINVYEHTEPNDDSNFEADIILRAERGPDNESGSVRNKVPIQQPRNGSITVPKEGDTVLVNFMNGADERPIIVGSLYTDQQRAPLGREGVYREKFGEDDDDNPPVYIEGYASEDEAYRFTRMIVKDDDRDIDSFGDASVGVYSNKFINGPEIYLGFPGGFIYAQNNGDGTADVRIDTQGDITLSAGGDIVIDEGGTAAPVAKQNHTHDFTTSDGASGTTGTPNESGTSTEIE